MEKGRTSHPESIGAVQKNKLKEKKDDNNGACSKYKKKRGAMRKRMYFNKTVIIILYIVDVFESTFKTCMCITITSGS